MTYRLGFPYQTEKSPSVLLEESENPNTDPAELQRIASIRFLPRSISRALATNPSTPPDALLVVGGDAPAEMLKNPLWNLLLATDPGLLNRMPNHTAEAIGSHIDTPVDLLRCLGTPRSRPVRVRAAVAANPNCPIEVLKGFFRHHQRVRTGLANNPNLPKRWQARLARDPCREVRTAVARRKDAAPDLLRALAQESSYNVRSAVAGNPRTPKDVLQSLSRFKLDSVQRALSANPAVKRMRKKNSR